jgi:glycosyltransferase involved in cell wall biosynthesis
VRPAVEFREWAGNNRLPHGPKWRNICRVVGGSDALWKRTLTVNLLIVSNNPDRASFRQRIGIHIAALQERGIACEVARLPAGAWSRRRLYRQANAFDAVFLHRKMLNTWDAFWLGRTCRRLIYDFDDAIMYNDRRPERISRIRFRRFSRSVLLADRIIAGNDYLADHARRYNPNVTVLPTSLDLRPYATASPGLRDSKIRLVWMGSRSTLRYLADLRPALEQIGARHENVALRIIADEFFDLHSMKVEKVAWSLAGEAADLMACDIGLAPLPDNPFTRGKCGFKILQYQAAGLPVVASPVGVNRDFVREGGTGFLAAAPAQWVARLDTLIESADLRRRMGQSGRCHVEQFDAKVIGLRFRDLVTDCLWGKA